MEGAEAGVILGSGFAEADVAADYFDDVGLLLYGLGKIGHEKVQDKTSAWGGPVQYPDRSVQSAAGVSASYFPGRGEGYGFLPYAYDSVDVGSQKMRV